MDSFDADLFVIGGGSGGVRAARIAAGHGARVMIAEEYRMGGTCVIRGCVPKKLMVYASHVRHELDDAAGFGWSIPSATFDWPTLIANKDREIARLEAAYTFNVEKAGARIVKTRAVFEDAHTLRLGTGVRYVGENWSGGAVRTPSYTLVDALAEVNWRQWRMSINATNLFNKKHYAACLSRGDCFIGADRNVFGTLTYAF
mgnify:CR=1 FL=1